MTDEAIGTERRKAIRMALEKEVRTIQLGILDSAKRSISAMGDQVFTEQILKDGEDTYLLFDRIHIDREGGYVTRMTFSLNGENLWWTALASNGGLNDPIVIDGIEGRTKVTFSDV